MKHHAPLAMMIALAAATASRADIQSGPDLDEKLPPLKAYVATGEQAEKTLDLAAQRKEKPTVYVLIQADHWTRPIGRYLRGLDTEIAKKADEAHVVAVWLTADEPKTKQYLPVVENAMKTADTTFAVYPDVNGPDGWGINTTAHVTTVLAVKGKPIARFGHISVNETLVREVLREFDPAKE